MTPKAADPAQRLVRLGSAIRAEMQRIDAVVGEARPAPGRSSTSPWRSPIGRVRGSGRDVSGARTAVPRLYPTDPAQHHGDDLLQPPFTRFGAQRADMAPDRAQRHSENARHLLL